MENIPKLIKNSTFRLSSSSKTFADIYDVMLSHGEKIMVERDEGLKEARYTYAEVDALIKRAAFSLKNIVTGQFVGLYQRTDLEWIVSFWAILLSGNKPFLMNVNLSDESLEDQMDTLGVKIIVTDKAIDRFSQKKVFYGELLGEGSLNERECGNQIALSTSGTGLKEKICVYSGEEISEQILNAKYISDEVPSVKKHYKGSLKLLMFLPFYHIFGLVAEFFWFAFFGRTFVSLADYSPGTVLRTIRKYNVTHVFAVPLLWRTIERNVIKEVRDRGEKTEKKFYKGLDLSIKLQSVFPRLGKTFVRRLFREVRDNLFGDSVSFCITGGSYVRQSTLKLINGLGYELRNGYGMTETGITSFETGKKASARVAAGVGKPFPKVEYKIADDGELFVKGRTTCKTLIISGKDYPMDDWFATGDIAERTDGGDFAIVGRKSDVVIGDDGENLFPDEVERHFCVDGAKDICVIGDEENRSLVIIVQLPAGAYTGVAYKINDEVVSQNQKLALSRRVRRIYYTFDDIKGKDDVKVSRAKLKRDVESGNVRVFTIDKLLSINAPKAEGEVADVLKTLFAKALGVEESAITPDANFFTDLGGTSLDYFSLIAAINDVFAVSIKFDEAHLSYTLSDMEKTVTEYLKNL